jgi:hypothetical protein
MPTALPRPFGRFSDSPPGEVARPLRTDRLLSPWRSASYRPPRDPLIFPSQQVNSAPLRNPGPISCFPPRLRNLDYARAHDDLTPGGVGINEYRHKADKVASDLSLDQHKSRGRGGISEYVVVSRIAQYLRSLHTYHHRRVATVLFILALLMPTNLSRY